MRISSEKCVYRSFHNDSLSCRSDLVALYVITWGNESNGFVVAYVYGPLLDYGG